jgi:phosphatidylethanolamine-binding protein (PEBP) family uncharacterized protein
MAIPRPWSKDELEYPGIILTPSRLKDTPSFNLTSPLPKLAPRNEDQVFVMAISDPDAPSRGDPKNGEFRHYLAKYRCAASNVVTTVLELKHAEDLKSYTPPAPPQGTGPHRYVVAAFTAEDDDDGDDDDENESTIKREFSTPRSRKHWGYGKEGRGLGRWAKENDLKAIGEHSSFHAKRSASSPHL